MAEREIPITVVVRTLDEDLLLAEPILFPELCIGGRKPGPVRTMVRDLARKIAEQSPNFTLHRRYLPGEATIETCTLTLSPAKKRPEWNEPALLEFHVIRWRHGTDAWLAFVPALGIEMVATRETDLQRMIPEHIVAALRRNKISESLFDLALTQRNKQVALWKLSLPVSIKSPKQLQQDENKEEAKKPVIAEVGLILQGSALRPAYAVDSTVAMLADAINSRIPRSVLLVGPSGVGKTSLIHELLRRRDTLRLGDKPFWATSGSRLIAGMSGFGMWQKRCQRLCKEAAEAGAILHLGNLVELMEVGRCGGGGQGLADFLRPYLGRGEIVAIVECTPEQLPLIERENPHLLELFRQLKMDEPSLSAGREILLKCAQALGKSESTSGVPWLDMLDRLHRRYATYSAYPGRPIRFLENLLRDKPGGQSLETSEVIAAFSRETGLPQFMLDPNLPLDLGAAHQWFAHRVIGQDQAVNLIVDLLATVKAALTRPRRPIASLLFIGPTGVGKTELAKALAEYFFGDRSRLTRFDMSEFATPSAVERLVGGAFGAEGLLTAKVREQPFSVILFDEFEKAHWGFFDLLLQVLGEGRLTDAAGRLGDFSNAIVVMTSNLGAEAFGRGTFGLTVGSGHPDPERHFTDEVRGFLRPELFNRIDRIVPFMPLDSKTIEKIGDRELSLTRQRDGFAPRGLTLEITAQAMKYLSAKGYDARYGARPLKRAIERELLVPLAEAVNGYPADLRLQATADSTSNTLAVTVRSHVDSTGRSASVAVSASGLAARARNCVAFRRDVQKLERCSALLALQNQLFLLERDERKRAAREKPGYDAVRGEQIKQLKEIVGPAAALSTSIRALEDEILIALYGSENADPIGPLDRLPLLSDELDGLLLALLARQISKPHSVTLALFGDRHALWDLAGSYRAIASDNHCTVQLHWFSRFGPDTLRRHKVAEVDAFLIEPEPKAIGMAMGISGRFAALRFTPEEGIHSFLREGNQRLCLVDTSDIPINDYEPPARVEFPDVPPGAARREYNFDTGFAQDSILSRRFSLTGRSIVQGVNDAMATQLRRAARGILEQ